MAPVGPDAILNIEGAVMVEPMEKRARTEEPVGSAVGLRLQQQQEQQTEEQERINRDQTSLQDLERQLDTRAIEH